MNEQINMDRGKISQDALKVLTNILFRVTCTYKRGFSLDNMSIFVENDFRKGYSCYLWC